MEAAITLLSVGAIVVAGTFFTTSVLREIKRNSRERRQRQIDRVGVKKPGERD